MTTGAAAQARLDGLHHRPQLRQLHQASQGVLKLKLYHQIGCQGLSAKASF